MAITEEGFSKHTSKIKKGLIKLQGSTVTSFLFNKDSTMKTSELTIVHVKIIPHRNFIKSKYMFTFC